MTERDSVIHVTFKPIPISNYFIFLGTLRMINFIQWTVTTRCIFTPMLIIDLINNYNN